MAESASKLSAWRDLRFLPHATPLRLIAIGTAAYLLCAVAAQAWLVDQPRFNPLIQILVVVLLSLALVTAIEGALSLLGIVPREELAGWPYGAACLASAAYSITYGPYVFINIWWHDDWGYLTWPRAFSPSLLTKTLNDHLSPLLNLVIWAVTNVFGSNYIGLACLQHGVFVALLVAVAHLFWRATKDARLVLLFLVTYASWPAHGEARFWFGGGFWLSASAAFLMIYLLHAQTQIAAEQRLAPSAWLMSAILASMTVLISSQTMIPAVFLLALLAPRIAIADDRRAAARRVGMLAAISLVPTVLIFVGRSIHVAHKGFDFTGFVDGALLRDMIGFFSLQAMMLPPRTMLAGKYWLPADIVFIALFVTPVVLALKRQVGQYAGKRVTDRDLWASRAGLVLLGTALLVVLFAQIGVARRWDLDAVLNSYYATLPLLAVWMTELGAVATLASAVACRLRPSARRGVAAASLVGLVLAVGLILSFTAIRQRLPLGARIDASVAQHRFLAELGTAICALAQSHRGESVAWMPKYSLKTDCPACLSMIAPSIALPDDASFLAYIAPAAARPRCTASDRDRVHVGQSAVSTDVTTDGADNDAVQVFYRDFFPGGR